MIELLWTRRSIRKFQDAEIPISTIDTLKEALLRAPSSHGKNPWEFIFVQDHEKLKLLSEAKEHGAEFLANTPIGIVICGFETISDVWVEDCSIAAILVQIVAHAQGLGSCWVQIRNRTNKTGESSELFIQKLLALPANLRVLAVIGVGVPAETKRGIPFNSLNYNKIHHEIYK